MKIEMYTSSWCQQCPNLKRIFNEINVDHEVIDIDTPEGSAKAQSNRIKSLPTTIIQTDDVRVVEVGVKNKQHWLDLLSGLM